MESSRRQSQFHNEDGYRMKKWVTASLGLIVISGIISKVFYGELVLPMHLVISAFPLLFMLDNKRWISSSGIQSPRFVLPLLVFGCYLLIGFRVMCRNIVPEIGFSSAQLWLLLLIFPLVALWYTLFLVYWFQHNENDVHRAYNRALEADIESSLSTLLTADAMFWSSTPSHAVPIYRRIIEKHPDVLYAYWMLGILLTELGHYRAAIPVMQEFLRRKPDAPYIWEPYSTAMLEAGWVEQLRTELNTATKNQPRNYMVWRSLGEVLLLQQDWEAGMKVFHRLMEVMPEDPFTRNGLASCLKGTDRVEASLKHYRKVAECEGTEFEGWMNLAFALQELGKEDEAQEAYDKAEAAAPGKFQFTMQQIQHQIDEVKARMV